MKFRYWMFSKHFEVKIRRLQVRVPSWSIVNFIIIVTSNNTCYDTFRFESGFPISTIYLLLIHGLVAQWIAHLTSDQKVAGSSPVWVALSVLFCKYFDFKSNFVALISTRGQEPCHRLLLYQQWSLNIFFHLLKQQNCKNHSWPSGAMDSASDFGSEGCRFESCLGRLLILFYYNC